ncbi:MAG: hypothetical protein II816_05665, partial [Elusimicrobia bacterium]|nr:hypothetical protein [Elusimicrobiota bacterium]
NNTETAYDKSLDIDARNNKYFTLFKINASSERDNAASFTATVTGNASSGAENIEMVLVMEADKAPVITENFDKTYDRTNG